MNMKNILFIAIGGSIGSVLRYLLSFLDSKEASGLPCGTLAVNIIGSLVFVFLYKNLENWNFIKDYNLLIFTGILGAFTTYSTFNFHMIKMINSNPWQFIVYALLTFLIPLILGTYILSRN